MATTVFQYTPSFEHYTLLLSFQTPKLLFLLMQLSPGWSGIIYLRFWEDLVLGPISSHGYVCSILLWWLA
jgi:hypothetical protein